MSLSGHLPRLLPGLLGMLGDGSGEIRAAAAKLLAELQLDLHQAPPGPGDAAQLALILAAQLLKPAASPTAAANGGAAAGSLAGSPTAGRRGGALEAKAAAQRQQQQQPGAAPPPSMAASARLTALRWLEDLVGLSPAALAPHCGALMQAVLPCLGSPDADISRVGVPVCPAGQAL